MVDALAVGNTILKRAIEENIDITPMKLQKLIFLVYKDYYKRTNNVLFWERFEVWKYGPVIRSVYDAFKNYGSNHIRDYGKSKDGYVYVVNTEMSGSFNESLDKVWSLYKGYNGIKLSLFTHRAGTAWRKAAERGKMYLSDDDIYNEEDYIEH